MKHLFVKVSIIITTTFASHGLLKDCYSCSKTNKENFMCNWGGQLPDPTKIVCCTDNKSDYCKPTKKNICTLPFKN